VRGAGLLAKGAARIREGLGALLSLEGTSSSANLSRAAAITQRRKDFLQFVLHNTLFPMRIWWLRSLCAKFSQSGFSQLRGITRPFSEL
jgi:hypothetical protein